MKAKSKRLVQFELPTDLIIAVDDLAAKDLLSRSDFIRQAIIKAVRQASAPAYAHAA